MTYYTKKLDVDCLTVCLSSNPINVVLNFIKLLLDGAEL